MTDPTDPTDPIDHVRALDPATSLDPGLVARARAEVLQRIDEPASTVTSPVASTVASSVVSTGAGRPGEVPGPGRPGPDGRSRLALAAVLAAVVVAAVGFGARLLTSGSGDVQEVESAHPDPDGDPEPDGDPGLDADRPAIPSTTLSVAPRPGRDPSPATLPPDVGPPEVDDAGPDGGPDPEIGPTPDDGEAPSTGAAPGPGFLEQFTGDTGLDRFRTGVYHRNLGAQERGAAPEVWGDGNAMHGGTWTGDHDRNCGPPDTQRTIESSWTGGRADFSLDDLVYTCRDHVMTTMGDVDGYSIVWFSPDTTFSGTAIRTVAWDVNVTDLGGRQWWEVSIVPAGTEFLATVDWLAGTANIGTYHPEAIVVGNGPFGRDVSIVTGGEDRAERGQRVCDLDPEGCGSKMIRRAFSVTDNRDGTITVDYGAMFTQTVAGSLPPSFEVYFKDHNYTPDKDGVPIGHTWHWDNVFIG